MKRTRTTLLIAALGALATTPTLAQSNISPAKKNAWCENTGWTNWRDASAGTQGVRVTATFLDGFIWSENAGWINVGNTPPGGRLSYTNTTGLNFGVNIGAGGFLNGYAWGENIGWINFNTQPALGAQGARYDPTARRFRGYAWGENIGWINLDDANAFVATLCPGDTNGDGVVNFSDLNTVLTNFGMSGSPGSVPGDLNFDGVVNFADLNEVLSNFGNACN